MGTTTGISWTHHTFNPWIGCVKVSPACANCYAERDTLRWGKKLWGPDSPRQVTSDANWKLPIRWNREAEKAGERRRVFCASLADVFEDRRDLDEPRARLWRLIYETPSLDWLLLTKRPENIKRFAPLKWDVNGVPDNVWLGTTAESQEWADERVSTLLDVGARIHFLSAEPLLGPLNLWAFLKSPVRDAGLRALKATRDIPGLAWVIVGGESGPRAREMNPEWAVSLRDQCRDAGVPFFMTQGWGNHPDKEPLIDGVLYREVPK